MRFRFLYLNEAGEEVEVGGLEELRACVAMGRVDENTLLFDAVTREWAPARAHSAYRLLADELEGAASGVRPAPGAPRPGSRTGGQADDGREPRAEDAPPRPDDDILGSLSGSATPELPKLTPVDEPDMPDAVELFLERQERERRLEADEPTPAAVRREEFHIVEPSDDLSRPDAERAAERPSEPEPEAEPEVERAEPGGAPAREPSSRPERSAPTDDIVAPAIRIQQPPTPIRRSPIGRRRRRAGAIALGALVVIAAWMFFDGRGIEAGDLPATASQDGPPPPRPAPVGAVADAVAEAEGSAFDEMVHVMDSLRESYGLRGGPDGWLDGHYLATASAYPHVARYWERYQEYTSELRGRDTALFRAGFVGRLREEGIEGPVLAMRLASALEDFRATQPAREALYQGMDSLAARALALHELLLVREADVDYDPVQPGTVSRDPVMEAFPNDEALQREIWDHLDGIFEAMDVVRGGVPGSRDQLTDAALNAIRQSPETRR